MNIYEVIKKKRDGLELDGEEIRAMINGCVSGEIPDYQTAAFLMAVYFRGMSSRECVDLTMAMADSGEKIDLSGIDGFKVDKHSTGGVGDAVTLVLAPLVAASGGIMAKMSGRELGHTGGTVDKLESIPGMRMELSKKEFTRIVNRTGLSVMGQTANIAPADKLLYAIRSITAAVDSIPLIASSIMSKKLAAGSDGIVLDVKTGTGAFMQKYEDALELAKTMVDIGEGAGRKMAALITSMEQPLGCAVGNAVEVRAAIEALRGDGPGDLVDLVIELGGTMLLISGEAPSMDKARRTLRTNLANGSALNKFREFIQAQGGNPDVVDNPDLLPAAAEKIPVNAPRSGWVRSVDALEVGLASKVLGAGRKTKNDDLDLSIGIRLLKKVGDKVKKGDPLAVFHTDGDEKKIKPAMVKFVNAYRLGEERKEPPRLFHARVTKDNVEEWEG